MTKTVIWLLKPEKAKVLDIAVDRFVLTSMAMPEL
jgi:hypothetical protein